MPDPVEQAPALSAHDAAMVAKVDSVAAGLHAEVTPPPAPAPAAPQVPPVRPEGVPEKFWDASKGAVNTEALLRSYAELERGKAAAPAPAPAQTPPVVPPTDPAAAAPAAAPPAPPAKVDLNVYSTEFATTGSLSQESYAALEAGGYPKAMVDTYIAGQQAIVQSIQQEAFTAAGGEDKYTEMAKWAQANLNAEDITAFDAAVSGTAAARKQAIVALKARFTDANGSDPALVQGEGGQGGAEGAYGSRAEVVAAMSDPRYKKDPAYRAMVSKRIDGMKEF